MWLSPNEVCIGVAVSVKNICARFITVSVKKLLHYRAGGLLQYRAFYYIIGQLLHYRAVITLSGVFYYIIGQLLQYRAFITLSVGTTVSKSGVYHYVVDLVPCFAIRTNPCVFLWAAVFTFNPYLLISINELLISIIHLLISINELLISIIHLLISKKMAV